MEALYFTADGASVDAAIGDLPVLPVPVNYPQLQQPGLAAPFTAKLSDAGMNLSRRY